MLRLCKLTVLPHLLALGNARNPPMADSLPDAQFGNRANLKCWDDRPACSIHSPGW
jgi:hypothetical protein